jgi:sigma-B regulation protein RsbU (phosphoserine phosphatase)
LPTDKSLLATTRTALRIYLRDFGAPAEVSEDVILAVDEACTNVLQHAYPDGGVEDNFRLRVDLEGDRILIEVLDDGIGFDGFGYLAGHRRPEDFEEPALSGRGMDVMRKLMTTVEVESPTATGGTRLRLIRQLPLTGD